jgi:hypothetical protein
MKRNGELQVSRGEPTALIGVFGCIHVIKGAPLLSRGARLWVEEIRPRR